MTASEIEIYRIAQKLDDVCEWTKGSTSPTMQEWCDILACIRRESFQAFEHLWIRFENEFPDTKPCVYCNDPEHRVVDCQLAKVEAANERAENMERTA